MGNIDKDNSSKILNNKFKSHFFLQRISIKIGVTGVHMNLKYSNLIHNI